VATGVQYLALLRGINVGGKNLVKMADLRSAFEEMEFADVTTYIASGNVVFRAPRQNREKLAARLESELTNRFGVELKVVLLTAAQLRGVVEGAPRGFGAESDLCDVIFIRKPLSAKKAFGLVETREGIDKAWQGRGVLYFSRLAAKASGSRLSKLAARPEYKNMTVRNWSTTRKLLALLDPGAGSGSGPHPSG
jgi:uncharacterized protein (DUF1697 family)